MPKKTAFMSDTAFGELQESLNEVLRHARGERADLRVTRVPLPAPPLPIAPSHVVRIRQGLNFSQGMFARLLNVSPRTVQDWEQGRREPSDAALKLLTVAERHPEVLLEDQSDAAAVKKVRARNEPTIPLAELKAKYSKKEGMATAARKPARVRSSAAVSKTAPRRRK